MFTSREYNISYQIYPYQVGYKSRKLFSFDKLVLMDVKMNGENEKGRILLPDEKYLVAKCDPHNIRFVDL